MRYRRLDANFDYTFGQGSQNFLVDSAATVAQAIRTALLLFQGEWFLDQTAGVPYVAPPAAVGQVVGYGTKGLYDNVIKQAILGVQGVLQILNYSSSLNPANRALTISAQVLTTFGVVPLNNFTTPIGLGYGVGAFGVAPFGE